MCLCTCIYIYIHIVQNYLPMCYFQLNSSFSNVTPEFLCDGGKEEQCLLNVWLYNLLYFQ